MGVSRIEEEKSGFAIGAFALILAGVLFPLALAAWAFSTHGAFDDILDYAPLRNGFALLGLASIVVLAAACAELIIRARSKDAKNEFPSWPVKLIAIASVFATLGIAAYFGVPQLVRSGDTPAQVLMTQSEAGSGMPGIAIAFYTEKLSLNTLEWGAAGGAKTKIVEEKPGNLHWFQLSGIEPGKQYEYLINGGKPVLFKTPPASGGQLHFAASGDPHFGNELSRNDLTRAMLGEIKDPANNYSMLFVLGDTADRGFDDALWKSALTSISQASSSVPTAYVLGNHDAIFGGAGLYQDYLCQPRMANPAIGCLAKRIDNGNVHFLILDVEWGLEEYTPEQKQWLEAQLAEIPKDDWCIVMSHTFYYSSGSVMEGWAWYDNKEAIDELVPLFERSGVDMVFSGHKHDAEVLQKNGITYVVMGAFGGHPNPEREYVSPASIWYKQGAYAFADVVIVNSTDAELRVMNSNYSELYHTTIHQNKRA